MQLAEENYLKNSKALNVNKKMNNYISVTLQRIGVMELDSKRYLRADVEVENIGDEKLYFSPGQVIITQNGNQYDRSFVSSSTYSNILGTGDIWLGVKRQGALFMEIRDSLDLNLKELIIKTSLSSYQKESRNIGDGNAILYNRDYVFKYDLTSVQLM